MRAVIFPPLVLVTALAACAPQAGLEGSELAATAKGGAGKVDVCHLNGSGSINILSVSSASVASHLAHGDHLAGTYYLDADGDGQGDGSVTADCLYSGYVENNDDCDDSDASVYSGAEEVCDDGIDNDCDGDVDEECTVELEITVAADNGVWGWINGEAIVFDDMYPDWSYERSAVIEVDSGEDYALSFYVEDWGGLGYFAASVAVDGVVEVTSGDGDFRTAGWVSPTYVNEWPRIAVWSSTPESASDSPNLLSSPGTTWGDWMQVGFNDSSWGSDTNLCTVPSNWNTATQHYYRGTFGTLLADGGEFVMHDFGVYPSGYCYSVGDSAAFYRTELSL